MLSPSLLKKLAGISGKENLLSSLEERICYSYDATGKKYLPDLVIRPASVEQVAGIAKIAQAERIPLIARGAGSGFVGGSLPLKGGIVLLTSRMNKIREIDRENFLAVVEPGVVTADLQVAVLKEGLFYPPDPSSLNISTLGGNVAQCAGGPHALKYGVTRDYCLGLEMVLASGEILNTGVKTLKGVVGYDLTRLIVGSEGTLGLVSKIILKLLPRPEASGTIFVSFPSPEEALQTVIAVLQAKIIPSALEFMDQLTLNCVQKYLGLQSGKDKGAFLLIEIEGSPGEVERDLIQVAVICQKIGKGEVKRSGSEEEREQLWLLRRSISPALRRLNPHKINEDIVVPRNRLPVMLKKLQYIGNKYGLIMANFGHAGDGNIHLNIMLNRNKAGEYEKAKKAVEEIFEAVLALGGTISGEHGVGMTKKFYLKKEIGELGVRLMQEIKNVFDPCGIMNPGKIF